MDLFQESFKNKDDIFKPYFFKFESNAQHFRIHYQAKNVVSGNYPHIGVTAREGIHVLYRSKGTVQWLNVDAFTSRNSPITVNMKYLAQNNQDYEILIYGPLLCEIELLKIEIDDDYKLNVLDTEISPDLLFVGGVHSFGIGCTACGVMFSNIIGRKFNKHYQNISFNENNHLKYIYDNLDIFSLNKIETIILELDYVRQDFEIFDEYAEKVIEKLKSKCNNLICWYAIPESESEKFLKLNNFLEKNSKKRGIYFLDLSLIYNNELSDMCTHSKNYINDAGNIMIYKNLFKQINEINKTPEKTNFNEKLMGLKNGIFKFNR